MAGQPGEIQGMNFDNQKPYGNYIIPNGLEIFSKKYPPENITVTDTFQQTLEDATQRVILGADSGNPILPVNDLHALILRDERVSTYPLQIEEVLESSTEILKFLLSRIESLKSSVVIAQRNLSSSEQNKARKIANTYIKTLKAYYQEYLNQGQNDKALTEVLNLEEYQISE